MSANVAEFAVSAAFLLTARAATRQGGAGRMLRGGGSQATGRAYPGSMSASDAFDWIALETHIRDRMLDEVRTYRVQHPSARIYGAAFHIFYGETGGVIYWPAFGIATDEDLVEISAEPGFTPDDLRWSPADWTAQVDPSGDDQAWAARAQLAAIGDDEHWDAVYDRFLRAFPAAAKDARRMLIADGTVEDTFIAIAMDLEWELIPLSLTPDQLREHFPELSA